MKLFNLFQVRLPNEKLNKPKMATKVGGLKVKSKSESSQNRTKRPAKYRSMTLRRQEAKLDVTTTETPEASFLYDTGTLENIYS